MIPMTFEEWKHCIVHDCGIQLTKNFAQQRLEVYQNNNNPETQKFVSLYGQRHLQNVIGWLQAV
ncbi:MAG: hypothetical protein MK081_02330 [Flavobacteriales bacterium]|nr:hypothetical protein [Flavobacteriales bacterium]